MNGHGEKQSRKQEQAIAALLTEPTLAAAAKAVGIGVSTIGRWTQDEQFQEDYRKARMEAVSHATAKLQQAAESAVNALRSIVDDEKAPASSRVSAAKTILDAACRATEAEGGGKGPSKGDGIWLSRDPETGKCMLDSRDLRGYIGPPLWAEPIDHRPPSAGVPAAQ